MFNVHYQYPVIQAEVNEIIRQLEEHRGVNIPLWICRAGSHAYGFANGDSDNDYIGVAFGKPETYLGFDPFEHKVSKEGQKPDYAIHELRKFLRLAIAGNPTILETLWIPPVYVSASYQSVYDSLVAIRGHFLTKKLIGPFGGYAHQQIHKCRLKLMGHETPGIKAKNPYKHAAHCLRLVRQCREVLEQGDLFVDRTHIDLQDYIDIRAGKVDIHDVLHEAESLKNKLPELAEKSRLHDLVNQSYIEGWLVKTLYGYLNDGHTS